MTQENKEVEYHKIEKVLTDFKNGATYSDSIEKIQAIIALSRQSLLDEVEGMIPVERKIDHRRNDSTTAPNIYKEGFNSARSEILNKLKSLKD